MIQLCQVRLDEPAYAVISRDQQYRYWLHRSWLSGSGIVVWVMLNPSTADATENDPTIFRCMRFSQRWGFGAMIVVNLYAGRTTEPKGLLEMDDPVGPLNQEYVDMAIKAATKYVVCAWGANRLVENKGPKMAHRLRGSGVKLKCLGVSAAGHPRHPLYLPGDKELEPFNG
jgi:hypothetical protein